MQGDKVVDMVRGGGHRAGARPKHQKERPQKSWGKASRRKPQCKGPQEPKEAAKQKAGQCGRSWVEGEVRGEDQRWERRAICEHMALVCGETGAVGSFFLTALLRDNGPTIHCTCASVQPGAC